VTTIAFRDNILAADQCHTVYDTEAGDEPTSRSFANKIRLVSIGAYHRFAIATRGDSIDGVLVERAIKAHIAKALEEGIEPHIDESFDDWGIDMTKTKWNDPDSGTDGIILYRDIRHEHTITAWEIDADPRVIRRVRKGCFVAVGCDSPLALAAMEAKAGATMAVWIAGKYGVATSGPVNFVNAATMVLSVQKSNPLDQ
jgi:hypothetical protein